MKLQLVIDDPSNLFILGIIPITNGDSVEVKTHRRGSRQKLAILEAVTSLGSHPTADRIFLQVRETLPGTSLSTVYRNLRILVDEGTLIAVSGPGAEVHYDHETGNHCHIQCRSCGKVSDVSHDPLDYSVIEPSSAPGFTVEGVCVTFTGICDECTIKLEKEGEKHES